MLCEAVWCNKRFLGRTVRTKSIIQILYNTAIDLGAFLGLYCPVHMDPPLWRWMRSFIRAFLGT